LRPARCRCGAGWCPNAAYFAGTRTSAFIDARKMLMWGRFSTCGRFSIGLPTSVQMPPRRVEYPPQVENLPHKSRSLSGIGQSKRHWDGILPHEFCSISNIRTQWDCALVRAASRLIGMPPDRQTVSPRGAMALVSPGILRHNIEMAGEKIQLTSRVACAVRSLRLPHRHSLLAHRRPAHGQL
jgi:hypothetical protein